MYFLDSLAKNLEVPRPKPALTSFWAPRHRTSQSLPAFFHQCLVQCRGVPEGPKTGTRLGTNAAEYCEPQTFLAVEPKKV